MKKCKCCDDEIIGPANSIYRKGSVYYCQKPGCQEMFIEDAGDPPDNWGEP